MTSHLLALDQGTSSSRSIVFDARGQIVLPDVGVVRGLSGAAVPQHRGLVLGTGAGN